MKLLRASLIVGLICFLNFVANAKQDKPSETNNYHNVLPNMVIKTITNKSPFSFMLIDRLNGNKSFIFNPGQTLEVNLKIESSENVSTNNVTVHTICKKAQFLIKKLNARGKPEFYNQIYFNTYLAPDADNAGGNIIIGGVNITKKMFNSVKANFIMINKGILNTYSYFYTCNAQINQQCALVEIDLTLSIEDENIKDNIFLLKIDGDIFPNKKVSIHFSKAP